MERSFVQPKVVKPITDSTKDNVILFPKTVDYYQIELTRMLETERYREAIDLLRFLLKCQGDDRRTHEEWKSLLDWLETTFPDGTDSVLSDDGADETEEDYLKQHVKARMEQDHQYAKKMLDMLLHDSSVEKKLLALNQLSFIDHPQINDTLKRWVENVDLHPLVQFKVLQTLKSRGMNGEAEIQKNGENVILSIERTPLNFDEFPQQMRRIMTLVANMSEVNYPSLSYFAQETWKDFLYYIYGTSIYYQLTHLGEDEEICVWAAALHHSVLESMTGSADERETASMYGLSEPWMFLWEQAYKMIKNFMDSAFRSG
jgi:hypothetical protein